MTRPHGRGKHARTRWTQERPREARVANRPAIYRLCISRLLSISSSCGRLPWQSSHRRSKSVISAASSSSIDPPLALLNHQKHVSGRRCVCIRVYACTTTLLKGLGCSIHRKDRGIGSKLRRYEGRVACIVRVSRAPERIRLVLKDQRRGRSSERGVPSTGGVFGFHRAIEQRTEPLHGASSVRGQLGVYKQTLRSILGKL